MCHMLFLLLSEHEARVSAQLPLHMLLRPFESSAMRTRMISTRTYIHAHTPTGAGGGTVDAGAGAAGTVLPASHGKGSFGERGFILPMSVSERVLCVLCVYRRNRGCDNSNTHTHLTHTNKRSGRFR